MTVPSGTWALVLAAGEGRRLRSLTTSSSGIAVPKQFCSLYEGPSLLEQTLSRAGAFCDSARICVVVAAQHRSWWQPALRALPAGNVIVQPQNRGTANGILLGLLAIARRDPAARIVLLPSDHHVRQEAILAAALRGALARLERQSETVLLLGVQPEEGDPELGYIVPGAPDGAGLLTVERFIEKPSAARARELIGAGGLWNTFIVVSRARTLLTLLERSMPQNLERMSAALGHGAGAAAAQALAELYERLPTVDFSSDVMTGQESVLRVLPVPRCGWTDLGTPRRVVQALSTAGGAGPSPWAGVGVAALSLAAQHSRLRLAQATEAEVAEVPMSTSVGRAQPPPSIGAR
jgi:mannose-1-phosphate guanylyltransferase